MTKGFRLFTNGESKTYGLIGKSLKHSFSSKHFAKKFETESISNCKYLHFELEDIDDFPSILEEHPELVGLNVTIPYKKSIIKYLDEVDRSSRFIGAVNTLKITRKKGKAILSGFNTDAYGFEKTFLPHLKKHHERALVLGTGGASHAVVYVLRKNGIAYKEVTRNPYKSNQISYPSVSEAVLKRYNIVINTTPVGMYPNVDSIVDIPYQFLNKENLLYDLVYNPEETQFLKKGRAQGATTINGLKMFELQAERSWKIWNKKSIFPFG